VGRLSIVSMLDASRSGKVAESQERECPDAAVGAAFHAGANLRFFAAPLSNLRLFVALLRSGH